MLTIQIGSEVRLRTAALSPDVLRSIRNHLTFRPSKPAYGARRGSAPEPVLFYVEDPTTMIAPRGALNQIRRLLAAHGIEHRFESSGVVSRPAPPRSLHDLGVQLRPYQVDAATMLLRKVQGVCVMPCGGGKTTTATAALLASGEPAIVIAHTRDILDQWRETIARIGGTEPLEVTADTCGPLHPGEVRVAMVQTLTNLGDAADAVLGSAGALVLDECHHAPATTWSALLSKCPARYRWGLTATPERSDGLGCSLEHLIGPVVYRIPTRTLIEQGWLLRPTIVPVDSGWMPADDHYPWTVRCLRCSKRTRIEDRGLFMAKGGRCARCRSRLSPTLPIDCGRLNYSKAVSDLSVDPRRVAIVTRLARLAAVTGRVVLVLLARKDACRVVRDALAELGVDAEIATGDLGKQTRRASLASIRSGQSSVIIATQLADEGLDLPSVDCVINASPGRSGGRAKQRVGRALRRAGADPLIFEIIDRGEFEGQWMARLDAYLSEYGSHSIPCGEPMSFESARSRLLSARVSETPKRRASLRF